jgi:RecA-family ATPase
MEKETRLWTITELIQSKLEMPRGLLNDYFLVPGTLALISGESGVGKTFLTSFLADSVATGTDFLGMPTLQAPVLYCSEELNAAEYRHRIIGMALKSTNGHFGGVFKTGLKLDQDYGQRALLNLVQTFGARLVIVDSLSRVKTGNLNYDDTILRMMGQLEERICRPEKCCLMFVHHAGKPDKDQPNDVRGSQALLDYPRDVMIVRKLKEEGLRVLSFRKATFGPEPAPRYFRLGSELLTGKTVLHLAESSGVPGHSRD